MSSTALFRTDSDLARRRMERKARSFVETSLGIVELRVTGDPADIESVWKALQAESPCTAAQTYDWARSWVRHVLQPEGREAAIAVGRAADGRPLFLWAFEVERVVGQRLLKWLGHAHANYNMGLFAAQALAFTREDISRLLHGCARNVGATVAILTAQPCDWDGLLNPFAGLPIRPPPMSGFA